MTLDQANQKAQEAWILIAEGELKAATDIGQLLIDAGFEVGYRIHSAIAEATEEWDLSETVIKEGIEAHPTAWPLHLQLGTLYTQTGRFEEAMEAFELALAQPEVETHWIHMNQAVVLSQIGQIDEALNLLQGIEHEEMRNQAFELKMQILDQFQQHEVMLEIVAEELEDLVPPTDEEEAALMSRILALVANACYYDDKPEKETRFYLRQAIEYDRSNEIALMVLREMRAEFTENGKLYGFLIQANLKAEEGIVPVMTTYGILADNQNEAMEMIMEFEVEALDRDSIEVMEIEETIPEEEEELKGIYMVGGWGFLN